jgi:isoleucyl-tRNA synthetase
MSFTRKVVELGRNLRTRHALKVRQPLGEIIVQSRDDVFEDLVLAELNVKTYAAVDASENIVKKKTKANFRKLGPLFGKQVPQVAKLLNQLSAEQLSAVESGEDISINLDGEAKTVPADCVEVIIDELEGMVAEGDGRLMVALKTELNDELLAEGFSREFVNRLQNVRKELNLEITDRIKVSVQAEDDVLKTLERFQAYTEYELLATLKLGGAEEGQTTESQTIQIDDVSCTVVVEKV